MSDQFSSPDLIDEKPAKKKNPWLIVLIIIGVIILLCCICVLVVGVLGPALLGPDIGNILSNIQEGLMTPAP